MVEAFGTRWTVEQCLEEAKGEVGLDEYEVRTFHGWYRHVTLSMLALTFLAALRASGEEMVLKKSLSRHPSQKLLVLCLSSRLVPAFDARIKLWHDYAITNDDVLLLVIYNCRSRQIMDTTVISAVLYQHRTAAAGWTG